jgi:AraC family transcriptional regulator of adaptative response / DNA-3-methyladenine glycosylase II
VVTDAEGLYHALSARDARFDGLFFVGVTTTGIYCRPVCPARTPMQSRCRFFRRAAEAEKEGFRACFRCRPELAPGGAGLGAVSALAQRVVARLEGELPEGGLAGLARSLGVSDRHLRRVVQAELGVTPRELALVHRLGLAKQLLRDTTLPVAEVAFASGFASVRRFNAVFVERCGVTPTALRGSGAPRREPGRLTIRLGLRPPIDWSGLLAFLGRRALRGVEGVSDGELRRAVRIGERTGYLRAALAASGEAVEVELSPSLAPCVVEIAARVRRLFDLDARPDVIAERFTTDPLLGPLAAKAPGIRLPGAFDGFEVAVRAILGQQVSVAAATTLAGRWIERFGEPIASPFADVSRLPPTAATMARLEPAELARVGLPLSRARTLRALAEAVASGRVDLGLAADLEATRAALLALPGIGPWTAEYVALRALGAPDAFPQGDLALRNRLGGGDPAAALARAEVFRPFRSYAALLVWSSMGGG